MEPCEHGEEKLLAAILIQACRDAIAGQEDAKTFLQDVGADLAERLEIAMARNVRRWAQHPRKPETLTIEQVANLTGCNIHTVYKAARSGDLVAYPSLLDRATWQVLPCDAALWAERYHDEHGMV